MVLAAAVGEPLRDGEIRPKSWTPRVAGSRWDTGLNSLDIGFSSRAGEWAIAEHGVPETFIVGRDGKIAYKMVGPLTPDNINTEFKAEIDKALTAGS